MSRQPGEAAELAAIDDAAVVEYLRGHPEFFGRQPQLLTELTLPHAGRGAAVSLIERQVEVLREQSQGLRHKLQVLTQTARGNEQLLLRLQSLLLELIATRDLGGLIAALRARLREDFHADAAELRLFGSGSAPEYIADDDPRARPLAKVVARGEPVCGYLTPEQYRFLFGSAGEEMASGALIPLCEGEGEPCLGVLGVGSVDPKRFHPEMGTVFLAHFGALVAGLVKARQVH